MTPQEKKEYMKKYRIENRDRIAKSAAKYHKLNRKRILKRMKKYVENHKDSVRKQRRPVLQCGCRAGRPT